MSERRTKRPRGFWAVWTAVAVDLLGFGIIIPLLPLYAERFGAGPRTIGLLFASYSLAQFVFSPLWGKISDRVGRKPVLLVTIAGSAIGSLTLGLAASLPILFVGRILDGVSGASVAVAKAAVADVASPAERPALMGLLGAAFGVGFVIGPAIGAGAALVNPAFPFLVAAGISILNLIASAVRLPETAKPEPPRREFEHERAPLPSAVLRLVALTFAGIVVFSAFETTFALLASDRLSLTDSSVALFFSAIGVVLVATQAGLVAPATRWVGEAGAIRLGLALNLVGFLMLSATSGIWMLLWSVSLLAVGQGLLTPVLSSFVSGFVPNSRAGAVLGLQQSASGLGRVAGPVLGGFLYAIAIPLPYIVAAVALLVAIPLIPAGRHAVAPS